VPYDLEWTCKPAFRYVRVEMCIRRLAFRSMLLRLSRRTKDCRGVRVYQTLSVLHCSSGLICAVPAQEAKTNRHQTLRVLPWSALLFCAHRRCLYPETCSGNCWFRRCFIRVTYSWRHELTPGAARYPVVLMDWCVCGMAREGCTTDSEPE
jgi:hypothetical protein